MSETKFDILLQEYEKTKKIKNKFDKYLKNFDTCFKKFQAKNNPNIQKVVKQQQQPQNNNSDKKNSEDSEKQSEDSEKQPEEDCKKEKPEKTEEEKKKEELQCKFLDFTNKLKKRIAMKTHPDKVKGKEKIFKKAIKAHIENDIFTLIDIASSLNIKIKDSYDDDIYIEAIKYIEIYQNKLLVSSAWRWFDSLEFRDRLRQIFSELWNVSISEMMEAEKEFELYKMELLNNLL